MRRVCRLALLLLAAGLLPARVYAQKDQVEDLRRQIQALQAQLNRLDNEPAAHRRVSDVGSPREMERNRDTLVVRLYDVSDLFAVAPNYEAQSRWPTTGAPIPPVPVFPQMTTGAKSNMRASGVTVKQSAFPYWAI